ncbi:MAG: hypothetical protein AAGA30_08055 [Planctomycetota bacterium]
MNQPSETRSGLPDFEAFYLNLFFKVGTAFTSDQSALNSFQQTTSEIMTIFEENEANVLSQEFTIPRIQGIEESSRHWSVLMVMDHLRQVNDAIRETIRELKNSGQPFQPIRIADYKPQRDVGLDVFEQFQETNKKYWAFVKSHMPLRTSLTFRHPWFGELNGHQWHCLATVHQKIHLRQIYKILAMIGVA